MDTFLSMDPLHDHMFALAISGEAIDPFTLLPYLVWLSHFKVLSYLQEQALFLLNLVQAIFGAAKMLLLEIKEEQELNR